MVALADVACKDFEIRARIRIFNIDLVWRKISIVTSHLVLAQTMEHP